MAEQEMRTKVIKELECCVSLTSNGSKCANCDYADEFHNGDCETYLLRDALALLKAQDHMGQNSEQYQCNKCKFYQGVHNVMGHAPCSLWNIGGVMWNDYCSRFHDSRTGGEV